MSGQAAAASFGAADEAGLVVAAVETVKVTLHARPDLVVHGAKGAHDRSDFLLVRVISPDGLEGYGEVSATPLWSGEDGTTAEHLIRTVLAPAMIGRSVVPVAGLEALMDTVLAGNPFTKSGVSIALWDLFAKSLGVPLAVALGGPHRTTIPVKLSLSGDGDRLAAAHATAVAAGFGSFKVKVGLGLSGDLERVRAARALVGPSAFLGADANGGWSRADAGRFLAAAPDHGLAFVEQPVAPDDLEAMAALRAHGIPIVADESVFGMADLRRVVRSGAADVVSIYVGKAGGPGRAVALGQVAASFGLSTLVGSNGEFGVGAAAQTHVAAALPGLTPDFPSDIIGAHYYRTDVLAEPLPGDGRVVRVPSGPGLGVRIDADIVRRFA